MKNTKRLLSFLLAAALTLGLAPASVPAAAVEGSVEITGGSYVDETADPTKQYEYTITGTDGSEQKVRAGKKTTGNGIFSPTTTSYHLVTELTSVSPDQKYLLVGQNETGFYAVKNAESNYYKAVSVAKVASKSETAAPAVIEDGHAGQEWKITTPDQQSTRFTFESADRNKLYLFITADGEIKVADSVSGGTDQFAVTQGTGGAFTLKNGDYWLYVGAGKRGNTVKLRSSTEQQASNFYLYFRMDEGTHQVDYRGMQKIIDQCKRIVQGEYTQESWATFQNALTAAQEAVKGVLNPFKTRTEAETALTQLDTAQDELEKARAGLTTGPKVTPLRLIASRAAGNDQASVTWDAKDGVTYTLFRDNVLKQEGFPVIDGKCTYHDSKLNPNTSYTYRVEGSDNSKGEVILPAVGDVNRVDEVTNATYYKLAEDPTTAAGDGLLVFQDAQGTYHAVTHTPGLGVEEVVVTEEIIKEEHPNSELVVGHPLLDETNPNSGSNPDKIYFEKKDDKAHLTINQEWGVLDGYTYTVQYKNNTDNWALGGVGNSGGMKLSRDYYEEHIINSGNVTCYLTGVGTGLNSTTTATQATTFYVYLKTTVQDGFIVNTAGLDELLAKADGLNATDYEESGWQEFVKARDDAKAAKNALKNPYSDEAAAKADLAKINEVQNKLQAAIDALKKASTVADATALQNLIEVANNKNYVEREYEPSTWKEYIAALDAANTAVTKGGKHNTPTEAANAQKEIDAAEARLQKAMDDLWPQKIVDVEWKARTKEPKAGTPDTAENSDLVVDLKYLGASGPDGTYPTIEWKWDDPENPDNDKKSIKNLTVDPSMTFWDYGTNAQYAAIKDNQGNPKPNVPALNGNAATWVNRGKEAGDWTTASVRKFSGTFAWPKGYGDDATIKVVSANDKHYEPIYKKIEEYKNGTPEQQEIYLRYRYSTVLPINDDMYVFLYKSDYDEVTFDDGTTGVCKAGTAHEAFPGKTIKTVTITNPDGTEGSREMIVPVPNEAVSKEGTYVGIGQNIYQDNMVFWTGTSGKGQWCTAGEISNDWKRTVPATYNNIYALPAYHEVWPNNVDQNGDRNQISNAGFPANLMPHTDGWYTMVDDDAFVSGLHNIYPEGVQGDQRMLMDIYCFDNSGEGGMDKLDLVFTNPRENETMVTIQYWLDGTIGKPLGISVISAVPVGTEIKLEPGTQAAELNHMKQLAQSKAFMGTVQDGVQEEVITAVKDSKQNVVNVIYHRDTGGTETRFFAYDVLLPTTFTFTPTPPNERATITKAAWTYPKDAGLIIEGNETPESGGKSLKFDYKPASKDGNGDLAYASVQINWRGAGQTTHYITVIPASNVLYEENCVHKQVTPAPAANGGAGWIEPTQETEFKVKAIQENPASPYGYLKEYEGSTKANGEWVTTLPQNQLTTTEALAFDFTGIAFDLIGSAGPNTGYLLVRLENANSGELYKVYMIDTRYRDGGKTIHQVPLLHEDNMPARPYRVVINAGNPFWTPGVQTLGMDRTPEGVEPAAYRMMQACGLTEQEIRDVEYVGFDGGDDVSLMAAGDGSATVSVDGFRVYRDAVKNADKPAYKQGEAGMIYTNVANAITKNFTAYVEPAVDGQTGQKTQDFTIADYRKNGGPAHEIYLGKEQSVVFQLDPNRPAVPGAATPVTPAVQISARAVWSEATAAPKLAWTGNDTGTEIKHNTEMYYLVAADDNNQVTITNKGEGLLALGNLKTNCYFQDIATAEVQLMAVESVRELYRPRPSGGSGTGAFVPRRFEGRVNSLSLFGRQLDTLVINTSADVAWLEVDGRKVMPSNSLLVEWGLTDQYTFIIGDLSRKDSGKTYQIRAFNAQGRGSSVYELS